MDIYRLLDDALARAVLVGVAPEQRALLGGASGEEHRLDEAEAAAEEVFCRALARSAPSPECRTARRDVTAAAHGKLPRGRRQALAAHLRRCVDCAWMAESLPGLADAVGAVASIYAETVVGPHEEPSAAAPHRRAGTTATGRSRRPLVAVAAAVGVGLAGVGVTIAQSGEVSEEPPAGGVEQDAPAHDPVGDHPTTSVPAVPDAEGDVVVPTDVPTPVEAVPGATAAPGRGAARQTGGSATTWRPSGTTSQPATPPSSGGEVAGVADTGTDGTPEPTGATTTPEPPPESTTEPEPPPESTTEPVPDTGTATEPEPATPTPEDQGSGEDVVSDATPEPAPTTVTTEGEQP